MIITIAICLIAALVVLANYKPLRNWRIMMAVFILTTGLLAVGVIILLQEKESKMIYSAFFSPFTAFILLILARIWYRKKYGKEIILYMRGLYPIRYEERYVTRLEKLLTFLITALSVVIPILILNFLT